MKTLTTILLLAIFSCTVVYAEGETKDSTKEKGEVNIGTSTQGAATKAKAGC